MEEDGIEAVLAKAIDLRLKITNCIHKATTNITNNDNEKEGFQESAVGNGGDKKENPNGKVLSEAEEDEDEEAERLLHIRDALESLEHQLSNLQALQQQQRYEKEMALGEIENNRKVLLDKLKEYKGDDLEVIQEASAFLCETVEHNTDLLLPPYPIRPPQLVDNHYLSHSAGKPVRNGVISGEAMKKLNGSENNQAHTISKTPSKGLGHVIGAAAKTVITIVGVISVLSLSGFGPNIGKRSNPFKMLGLFQQPSAEEKKKVLHCPPGRVLVLENGEARCIVKERVAIPFELAVAKPDVNYGSG